MKAKGTVVIDGRESDTTSEVIYKGLDHFRREFGNDQFHGVIVVDGDKGWRKFGDNSRTIRGDGVANEKRNVYLLRHPDHARAAQGQRLQIRDRRRGESGRQTGCHLESDRARRQGLHPLLRQGKRSAGQDGGQGRGIPGSGDHPRDPPTRTTRTSAGSRRPPRFETKRDGEKFQDIEVTEFKVLDKVDPDAFAEPK